MGAITVAPSDPNVVYVGMGETDIRGNISPGDGIYKTTDGGQSWSHIGLRDATMIADIVVDPTDHNIVLASAMGNVFTANSERGIFKSTNGGSTWRKVLFRNDSTGGMTLKMDPNNSRIVYASLWQAYRNAWSLSSGGSGSGLFKSTDGGETWKNMGLLNSERINKIIVDPTDSKTIYVCVPGKLWSDSWDRGVYRSSDAEIGRAHV